jgi:hypothetical protein
LDHFKNIQKKYQDVSPYPGFSKYLDIRYWMEKNLHYLFRLNLHRSEPQKILDLGTGCGYFPYLCRYFGHSVWTIDLDEVEMYNEMIKFFELDRRACSITAYQNLPKFDTKFDLITALNICFNNHNQSDVWGVSEWKFFLTDLSKNLLSPNGRVFLKLNPEGNGKCYDDLLLKFYVDSGAKVDGEYIFFPSLASFR